MIQLKFAFRLYLCQFVYAELCIYFCSRRVEVHHTGITIIITTTGAVAEEEDLVLYAPFHTYNHSRMHTNLHSRTSRQTITAQIL